MHTHTNNKTYRLILCALFASLIAVGAFIKVPIPYVPFTLQAMFTILAGLLLGARLGAMSAALYVGIGLLGIPVFTLGGGPGYVFQPTFGYLLGFIVGTYVTGKLIEKKHTPSIKQILCASYVGLCIIYAIGMPYYYLIMNVYLGTSFGIWPLILYCFLMTIPGDILLCILGAFLTKRLRPLLNNKL